jgi:hypothetical protein
MTTRRSRLTRHTVWMAPVLIASCAWGVVIWVAAYDRVHAEGHAAKDDLIAIAGAAAIVLTVVGLVLAIRNAWRTRSAIRQERHDELVRQRYDSECAAGWRDAQALVAQLLAGQPLEPLTVWGLVLRPGETAYLDLTASCARLAPTPYGNEAWTAPQPVRIITTDRRLLCDTGRWTSYWFHDITGFYPDLECWSVVLDLDREQPISLTGASVSEMAVHTTTHLYGVDGLRHPGLSKLRVS